MAVTAKCLFLFALLVIASTAGPNVADGAGECGRSSPDQVAFQMAPCASAAQDEDAAVSDPCCATVHKLGQNPRCLCAVMLSNTAKMAGIRPQVAMSIPKRCNLSDRPVGYKCGDYSLP